MKNLYFIIETSGKTKLYLSDKKGFLCFDKENAISFKSEKEAQIVIDDYLEKFKMCDLSLKIIKNNS